MKDIHIECKPDERLVKKLGFTKKHITHHQGKSSVMKYLSKNRDVLAMVDEDPHSPKMPYEKKLRFIDEIGGVKFYDDSNNNKVAILKVKLEDWIISLCNSSRIDIEKFGLEKEPNYLHSIINDRLDKFDKLIDYLLASNNPVLTKMKDFFEIKHRQN